MSGAEKQLKHAAELLNRPTRTPSRLKNAEERLDRLERTRARLEETTDPDEAIEVLTELSEIAKEVEAQLQQAKREAES